MAKNKKRHGKESEYHLGIIRELRKEIKNLKQRIKQLERLEYNYLQNKQPKDYEYKEEKVKLMKCPRCENNSLEQRLIVGRVVDICICGYRSKAKNI